MPPTDERYTELYKVPVILVVSFLQYYFIDYIFWSMVLGCGMYASFVYFRKPPRTIDPNGKAILITGCDSGFGKDLAIRAHKLGFTVFAGCYNDIAEGPRELDSTFGERMHVLRMDVTKDSDVIHVRQYVQQRCRSNGLWAVVNNAGIDGSGPVEICSLNFYKEVCEVNLFGVIRVTKAFLPLIRQAKGRVINVSSEKGLLARGGQSPHCISKCGVEAFSDSLRHEMRLFGVQVSLIEPGYFGEATAILKDQNVHNFKERIAEGFKSAEQDVKNAYRKVAEELVKDSYIVEWFSRISTDAVIDTMERQLIEEKVKARYLIGGTSSFVDLRVVYIHLKKFLPDSVMDYLLCNYFLKVD